MVADGKPKSLNEIGPTNNGGKLIYPVNDDNYGVNTLGCGDEVSTGGSPLAHSDLKKFSCDFCMTPHVQMPDWQCWTDRSGGQELILQLHIDCATDMDSQKASTTTLR